MPSITLKKSDGAVIETVKSHLVVITAGTVTRCLHLHKGPQGHWVVSDPRSGGKVLHVDGQYKGIRVASRGFKLAEIRGMAFAQVEALISRVGSDKFNAVLDEAYAKQGKTLAPTV